MPGAQGAAGQPAPPVGTAGLLSGQAARCAVSGRELTSLLVPLWPPVPAGTEPPTHLSPHPQVALLERTRPQEATVPQKVWGSR